MINARSPEGQFPHNLALGLLGHVDQRERSTLHAPFLDAVRGRGACTPADVVAHVVALLDQRVASIGRRTPSAAQSSQPARFRRIIVEHPEEALALAADAFRSPEERRRDNAARNDFYRRAWMNAQPPTEPQRRFLSALGYRGPVANRADASDLIEERTRTFGRPG